MLVYTNQGKTAKLKHLLQIIYKLNITRIRRGFAII